MNATDKRYTLCILFVDSRRELFVNEWDWILKFKSLHELIVNRDFLIDETVKKHLIIDNLTDKKIEI